MVKSITEVMMRLANVLRSFLPVLAVTVAAGCGSSDDSSGPAGPPDAGGTGGAGGASGAGGTQPGVDAADDSSRADGNAGIDANVSPDASGGAGQDAGVPDTTPDAVNDTTAEAAAETGEVAGLGCGHTARRGFTSAVDWPDVAACGAPVGYDAAVTDAAATCAAGWHMCTLDDVNALVGDYPDFVVPTGGDPDIGAWLAYTDTDTTAFSQYWALCGQTLKATANLQGTGPCNDSGQYPDGYRLRVSHDTWGQTHDTSLGCKNHADHECGYPGGTVPLAPQYTLCCLSE